MINIFSSNYLSRKPVEQSVVEFAKRFIKGDTVLDIGCGDKPYQKYFSCTYLGLDNFPEAKAEIRRDAWDTGLADNSVDGIVLNQSLEHIFDVNATIAEIERILKHGGVVLVTAPQTMRNHTAPVASKNVPHHNFDINQHPYWNVDYWRFTKFGLILLFKNFHIDKIEETNTYLVTLVQLINYFFASFGFGMFLTPIYLVNNIFGIMLDSIFMVIGKLRLPGAQKFDHLISRALTLNYILIARKL